MEENELFSQTIKKGRLYSQCWWERHARTNLKNTDFQTALWFINMKNRFGWKDKQETEHSGEINTNLPPIIVK